MVNQNLEKEYIISNSGVESHIEIKDNIINKNYTKIIKSRFNPRKVLDIGCSNGLLVREFQNLGISAYGVDKNRYVVENSLAENIFQIDLENQRLPFNDNEFDYISCFGTLEYIKNYPNLLKEIERVSKKGCIVTISTLTNPSGLDEHRINIHPKSFWLEEFGKYGFNYSPQISNIVLSGYIRARAKHFNTSKKFKLAYFLYNIGLRGLLNNKYGRTDFSFIK